MKIVSTLILILALAAVALPCGAPVVIEGRATVNGFPIPGTLVAIYAETATQPIEVVPASPFGYFTLSPVLPCNGYQIRAVHPKLSITFAPQNIAITDLPQDGTNLIVNLSGAWQ